MRRAALLLEDLRGIEGVGDVAVEATEFQRLAAQAGGVASLDELSRLDLYHRIRTRTRFLAFKNPLVTSRPISFMQRRRAVGYMLYEYLGWYYAHGNDPTSGLKNPKFPTPKPGGGVYVLEHPGRTLQTRELISGPYDYDRFNASAAPCRRGSSDFRPERNRRPPQPTPVIRQFACFARRFCPVRSHPSGCGPTALRRDGGNEEPRSRHAVVA